MKVVRSSSLFLVALVISLSIGCGGDDGGGEEAATTDTTATEETGGSGAAAKQTTTMKMDEYSFDPEDVVAKRGATITVENAGQIAHNLTVEQGTNPREEGKKLAGTSTFLGGKSEKLNVDVKPGKYSMACTVPGHRELGMTGSFTVE